MKNFQQLKGFLDIVKFAAGGIIKVDKAHVYTNKLRKLGLYQEVDVYK
jgi:hypothetical protein